MKIRSGLVSNSSSSSFIVKACCLSDAQRAILDNHPVSTNLLGHKYSYSDCADDWNIDYDEEKEEYSCRTFMDNFRLREFLEDLHIKCGRENSW
jgi:hypothetical protein